MQKEIKLSIFWVVAIVGVVMASMIVSYLSGFYFGQKSGYDNAMNEALVGVPKYPIVRNLYKKQLDPEQVSNVYAKLGTVSKHAEGADSSQKEREVPVLKSIDDAAGAPMIGDLAAALIEESDKKEGDKKELLGQAEVDQLEKTLSQQDLSRQDEKEETLGKLLRPLEEKEAEKYKEGEEEKKQEEGEKQVEGEKQELEKITPKLSNVEKKPEPPQEQVEKVSRGWYAQVGSFRNLGDAKEVLYKLRSTGFPAVIESASVAGDQFYRVLAGPEKDRNLADRLASQVYAEDFIAQHPFVKYVR